MKKTRINPDSILWVDILEAKPNEMFSEDQRRLVRFLHYSHPVKCAQCGRRRKRHWTLRCSFKARDFDGLLTKLPESHMPLSPVCPKHLLEAAESPA